MANLDRSGSRNLATNNDYQQKSSRTTTIDDSHRGDVKLRESFIRKLLAAYVGLFLDIIATTWSQPARADLMAYHLLGELYAA